MDVKKTSSPGAELGLQLQLGTSVGAVDFGPRWRNPADVHRGSAESAVGGNGTDPPGPPWRSPVGSFLVEFACIWVSLFFIAIIGAGLHFFGG